MKRVGINSKNRKYIIIFYSIWLISTGIAFVYFGNFVYERAFRQIPIEYMPPVGLDDAVRERWLAALEPTIWDTIIPLVFYMLGFNFIIAGSTAYFWFVKFIKWETKAKLDTQIYLKLIIYYLIIAQLFVASIDPSNTFLYSSIQYFLIIYPLNFFYFYIWRRRKEVKPKRRKTFLIKHGLLTTIPYIVLYLIVRLLI